MGKWLQRLPAKLKGSNQLFLHEKDSLQEKVKGTHVTSLLDILQSCRLFSVHGKYHSLFLWKEQAARSSTATAAEVALAPLTPVAAAALLCGHTASCADKWYLHSWSTPPPPAPHFFVKDRFSDRSVPWFSSPIWMPQHRGWHECRNEDWEWLIKIQVFATV